MNEAKAYYDLMAGLLDLENELAKVIAQIHVLAADAEETVIADEDTD